MDFFGQQDRNRRQSVVLFFAFVLALLTFTLIINLFVGVLSVFTGNTESIWQSNRFTLVLTAVFWMTVVCGAWFRWLDVRAGGAQLAKRFGAVPVLATSRNETDRQLLDVVAEMSVAASTSAPGVYCLRHEKAINALVLGNRNNVALVVSQAALDMLDREEIQGVVAHEFGHLSNGDLRINMRLLIALGGLNAIDEVGQTLVRSSNVFDNPRSTNAGSATAFYGRMVPGYFLLLLGYTVRAAGLFGVLSGNLLCAAISRQREFLADATAVQFTRSPYGIASALDRIDQYSSDAALHSPYAHELSHLCFQVPPRLQKQALAAVARLLATHPHPRERIKAIDPHFAVKSRKRQQEVKAPAPRKNTRGGLHIVSNSGIDLEPSGLSDRFEIYATDQVSCLAILFALFLSDDPELRENYLSAVGFAYTRDFKHKVRQLHETLGQELIVNKLRIIRYIAPRLRQLKAENRRQVLLNLEKLSAQDSQHTIEHFAAIALLRKELDSDIPVLEQKNVTVSSKDAERPVSIGDLGKELSLLLSLMVEASGFSGERAVSDYQRVLKCYTNQPHPMRSAQEPGIKSELEQAFHALYRQPLFQRQSFVRHCTEIMRHDGIEMEEERVLLDLIAASLDVPRKAA